MKNDWHKGAPRQAAAQLRAAMLALALAPFALAHAEGTGEDASPAALTGPTNSVEVGVGDVSSDSVKGAEYNGLQRKGLYGIGNLDLRGGGAFDSNDPTRWRISGSDLGLETRELHLEYGVQGVFRLKFGYEELLRNGSSMYQSIQSPLQGVGGTNLSLPTGWSTPLYPSAAVMGSATAYPGLSATNLGLAATSISSPLVTNTAYFCKASTTIATCSPNAGLQGAYTTGFPTTGAAGTAYAAVLAQNAADLGSFNSIRFSTKRSKENYSASYELSSRWSATVGMQREYKNGLKPLGVVNSDKGPAAVGTTAASLAGENSVIIPQLIDTITDQYTASASYRDESSYFTLAYFGEIFDNHAKSMTVADPWGGATFNGTATTAAAYGVSSATITEEPNNTFNQFRLTGGHNFAHGLRVVADAAYGRNAQNDSYVLDPGVFATPTGGTAAGATNNGSAVPANSANALIITKSFDIKLNYHPAPKWNYDVTYKYDDRDNRTPVNTYMWSDAGGKNFIGGGTSPFNGATGVPAGPIYSGANIVANRPYSKQISQLDLDADYAIARGQSIKAGAQWQAIDRRCAGTWIDCSFADTSRETTGKLEYRYRSEGPLSGRLGIDRGQRVVDYNSNAWMSLVPALGATNLTSLAANGYGGSVLGFLNAHGLTPYGLPIGSTASSGFTGSNLAIYNLLFGATNGGLSSAYYANANVTQNWPGLDIYNMANRTRDRVRGAIDWQASERFTVQTGFDYRHDNYPDSVYGLQKSTSWALNLDGDFNASEDLTLSAYFSHEDQRNDSAGNSATNGAPGAASAGTAYTQVTGATTSTTGTNSTISGQCTGDPGLLTGPKIASCTGWQSEMRDRTDTLGLAFAKKHLVVRPLSLAGNVSYSHAVSGNAMTGGFYYANSLAPYLAGVPALYYINAAALPDIVTSTVQLHLTGSYQVTKSGTVRVAYSFSQMHVNDYEYGTTSAANTASSVIPVMAQAPDYKVSVVGLSYLFTFQ